MLLKIEFYLFPILLDNIIFMPYTIQVPFKHIYENTKFFLALEHGKKYPNYFLYDSIYNIIKGYRPEYSISNMELIKFTNNFENGQLLNYNSSILIDDDLSFYIRKKGYCTICCCDSNIIYTPCQHQLCSNCYNNVSRCPFCRYIF